MHKRISKGKYEMHINTFGELIEKGISVFNVLNGGYQGSVICSATDNPDKYYIRRGPYCDAVYKDTVADIEISVVYERSDKLMSFDELYNHLLDKAYKIYVTEWLINHGYSIEDAFQKLKEIAIELSLTDDLSMNASSAFDQIIDSFYEQGFNGELFACKEEFEKNEFRDPCLFSHYLSRPESALLSNLLGIQQKYNLDKNGYPLEDIERE